jgi:hypothetical protein
MRPPVRNITIREADTIWREEDGWFDAGWHFSFDRYRDPEQMGVGALRVFNRVKRADAINIRIPIEGAGEAWWGWRERLIRKPTHYPLSYRRADRDDTR